MILIILTDWYSSWADSDKKSAFTPDLTLWTYEEHKAHYNKGNTME